jgi:hypothetical protein
MGYHKNKIPKFTFGTSGKITEEYLEWKDAATQNNKILELCELADLIGAIEGHIKNAYNLTLDDLIVMKNATKTAFLDGSRISKDTQ